MTDNNDIALLTKVNELANRYGLNPCHFIATIRVLPETRHSVLFYEMPVTTSSDGQERFYKMLESLGVDRDTAKLTGTTADIYSSLEVAIQLAPRPRRQAGK